jgi:transmembrane 9 superfamily protein 1
MAMAGFLPFSAISIELYYIFVTIWGHKLYTLYGILIIVFCILLLVTSFITIALVYFQLSLEDYRWWWRSIFNGGFAISFHFFFFFFLFFSFSLFFFCFIF